MYESCESFCSIQQETRITRNTNDKKQEQQDILLNNRCMYRNCTYRNCTYRNRTYRNLLSFFFRISSSDSHAEVGSQLVHSQYTFFSYRIYNIAQHLSATVVCQSSLDCQEKSNKFVSEISFLYISRIYRLGRASALLVHIQPRSSPRKPPRPPEVVSSIECFFWLHHLSPKHGLGHAPRRRGQYTFI